VIKHGHLPSGEVSYRGRPEELLTVPITVKNKTLFYHKVKLHLKKKHDSTVFNFLSPGGESLQSMMTPCKASETDYWSGVFDWMKAGISIIIDAVWILAVYQAQTMDLVQVMLSGPMMLLYGLMIGFFGLYWRFSGNLSHTFKMELHCLEPEAEEATPKEHFGVIVGSPVKLHHQLGATETTPEIAKKIVAAAQKASGGYVEFLKDAWAEAENTTDKILTGRAYRTLNENNRDLQNSQLRNRPKNVNTTVVIGVVAIGIAIALCVAAYLLIRGGAFGS
jgi:hypothetical protein